MGSVRHFKEQHKDINASSSIPLIGMVPSSVHLVICAGQAITGLACTAIFGISGAVTGKERHKALAKTSVRHLKDGLKHSGYNLVNLATLSIFLTIKERDSDGMIKRFGTII